MPLEKSLNLSPYFDDFDADKEFYRVLFKPGVAVQARELNQLQTLLQNQVERFGNHVFKSGTIISGVNFNYIPSYSYVKILDTQIDGQPALPSGYVGFFVKNSLNLTARVVDYKDGLETSDPDLKTLYLRYINSSNPDPANSSAIYSEFASGQQLTVFGETNPLFKINVNNGGVGFSNSDSVVILSSVTLANVTGAFSNGETITQSTTNAKGVIKAINTTAIACTTILQIAPRTADLTNTSVNSTAWSFQTGYSIVGGSSGATANIGSQLGSGASALLTTDTQGIIQTITVGNAGEDFSFLPTVTVKTSNVTATVNNLDLLAQNFKTKITVGNSSVNAIGSGYAFGVTEGLIYQKGYFLKVEPQTIIIDKYSTTPNNVVVGFKTEETYVDSNEDESLFDNASNTTNYGAPGADRLKLTPVLTTLTTTEAAANIEFFALAEWKDGFPYKENRVTVYSQLADEMAKRTREAQGSFIIDKFQVTTREKTTANTDYVNVVIDPGVGYVEGYRVSTSYNNYLDLARSKTQTTISNQSISASFGNYIIVNELAGLFLFKTGDVVKLYNTAKTFISSVTIPSSGAITPAGSLIGTARMRSLVYDSGEPGTAQCKYRLYLFDVQMDPGASFRNVKSIYYDGAVQDGVADVVQEVDATSSAFITKLIDSQKDNIIFAVGGGVAANVSNVIFTYRTSTDEKILSTTGELSLGTLGAGLTYPYNDGTLSAAQKQDIIVFPVANVQAASNLSASSISLTSGSVTITGSGTTFNTELNAGDFVRFSNSSASVYYQIASVTNATSATLTVNSAVSMTAANATLFFPALYPIALSSRSNRTVTISGSSKSATVSLGTSTNTTVNAIAVFNIRSSNASPISKSVTRDVFVKIHTSNNEGSNTGPWSLGIPSTIRLKNVFLGNNTNVGVTTNTTVSEVTKYFYIDYGEDQNAYRMSKLVLKNGTDLAVNTSQFILAQFDVLTTNGTEGFFTVDSYPINDTANLASSSSTINTLEIPEVYSTRGGYIDLRNAIDFRPFGQNTAIIATSVGSATVNPSDTFTLNTDEKFFPVPDSTINFDATYYNSRADRVIVRKDGVFEVLQGTPSLTNPVAPDQPPSAVTLTVVAVPPYPSLPRIMNAETMKFATKRIGSADGETQDRLSASRIKAGNLAAMAKRQPKRYTMEDIGKLERRLAQVEYAVKLNAVEAQVKDIVLPSNITPSVDRFKHGYFVDDFDNYTYSDLAQREFRSSVDARTSTLTPPFNQVNIESEFNLNHPATNNSVVQSTLMLPYSQEPLMSQVLKNIAIGADGQDIRFLASGDIQPPSFSIKARGEVIDQIATVFFIVRDQMFTVAINGLKPLTPHFCYFERNLIDASKLKPKNGKLGDSLVTDADGKLVFDYYYDSGVSDLGTLLSVVQQKVASLGGLKEIIVAEVNTPSLAEGFEEESRSVYKGNVTISVYIPPESEFVVRPSSGTTGAGAWAGGGDFGGGIGNVDGAGVVGPASDFGSFGDAASAAADGYAAADGVGSSGFGSTGGFDVGVDIGIDC